MNKSFIQLYKQFKKINKKGWIKSQRKGYGGIGYTFESLIGKEEESFPIPDYNGIEIKTMRIKSSGVLHLFSIIPDGDYLFPMERIRDILGYPDKNYKEFKILNMDFNCVDYTKIGLFRKAIIRIDRSKEKLYIEAIKDNRRMLKVDVSWSFKLLKDRLYLKLKELVVVKAESKIINDEEYYKYKKIDYYVLKDFNTFLKLIEDGTITIGIKIGIKKDKEHLGQMKSRGTYFSIYESNIEKLYKKIPLRYFEYQLL